VSDASHPPDDALLFLFESAHFALWAEDVARERAVEVKVVPAPPQAEATCGLALAIPSGAADALEEAFTSEGISFRRL
jgi:hypothetical protein